MILGALLTIFKWIALFIISLIPKFPDYSSIASTSLEPILETIHTASSFVSMQLFVSCLLIIFIMHNIEFIFSLLMWIVRKIPGVS